MTRKARPAPGQLNLLDANPPPEPEPEPGLLVGAEIRSIVHRWDKGWKSYYATLRDLVGAGPAAQHCLRMRLIRRHGGRWAYTNEGGSEVARFGSPLLREVVRGIAP